MVDYEALDSAPSREEAKALLSKLVVLKLNGGLGTTMGCSGPKSTIEVARNMTFLDLIVRQIEHLNQAYGVSIPLVLMDSFSTHDATIKIVSRYAGRVDIRTFEQKAFPRVLRDTLQPSSLRWLSSIPNEKEREQEKEMWYPPGHGDVYDSFYHSDLYSELKSEGKTHLFISNSDNLGATVDLRIFARIVSSGAAFCMEVTKKTRADVKGGTLVTSKVDQTIRLLEIAQVPSQHVDEFKSITKFRVFNTNNLWVSMAAMAEALENQTLEMDIIVNPKQLANGVEVIQLEQAAGAAIRSFGTHSLGITVPRSRFLPVKSTADLMLVQSNLYKIEKGSLVMNPERFSRMGHTNVPLIRLGHRFKKVGDYLSRFKSIPDMLELESLTVSGDVVFGKNVVFRGTVIIIADEGEHLDIPDGAVLDNKIVTGTLRILEH